MTASADSKIIKPAKANIDPPKGVKVERQPSGAINSGNAAGGEVDRSRYSK